VLGAPTDALVAIEATGHYWKNLFAALIPGGFAVALLNPLRTRRFAGEGLERTQTDAINAVGIARLAAQKRPPGSRLADRATEELGSSFGSAIACARTSVTMCASTPLS
jgi:transposase